MAVSVSYNLLGAGWSECMVEVGEQRVEVTASYLSDALGDLLEAVVAIVSGARKAAAVFTEEPGEYRWHFHRIEPAQLSVRILWFRVWRDSSPEAQGEVVLEAQCRLRTFAGAVLAASQRVFREHGLDGYRKQWCNHDFPLELQDRLKRLLDEVN